MTSSHFRVFLLLALCLAGCAGLADQATNASEPPRSSSVALNGGGAFGEGEDDGRLTATDRKLIKTGDLRVVVDDYDVLHTALTARLKELNGFIADSDLNHSAGRVSYATLVLRVPAEQFDELLGWTETRVEVQSLRVDTADVTARWTDVQVRIDNGKRTEQRLLGLLQTDTADLEDVLAVERELARVRGEVESAEGQMRLLSDQVGLATLTLQISVRAHYEPAIAMAYGARITSAFTGSIAAMVDVVKGLGIIAVALLPWLLVLGVLGWITLRVGRTVLRAARA